VGLFVHFPDKEDTVSYEMMRAYLEAVESAYANSQVLALHPVTNESGAELQSTRQTDFLHELYELCADVNYGASHPVN
jgi:hypothetical protein